MSTAPTSGTVEAWAYEFITSCELSHKREPPPPPSRWEEKATARRLQAPGRPPELQHKPTTKRSVRKGQLQNPTRRAELLHTFWHHELQAAELMAWALLAFPDSPLEFRQGVLEILQDELRHMAMYQSHIEHLGSALGDFAVRDWFWERFVACENPIQFTATLGIGLEGANLDHSHRFAGWFREFGDERGAAIQDVICEEEISHVQFAMRWFRTWTGGMDYDTWAKALIPPLSPALLRDREFNLPARHRAGFSNDFLEAIRACPAPELGS